MIDYTHDLHTRYCQHSHCQLDKMSKHDILASQTPPNISPLLPSFSPSDSPQGESEGTQGPHGGNNRALVTLSSDCLHKILPHKSFDGLQRLQEALKIGKEGSKWPQYKCVFSQPFTFSSLSKLSEYFLCLISFCIFKNCCRIILILPQFYFSGERAKYTQRILWRNLLLSYLEDGHFNLFNLVILTHTNFRHNS